MAANESPRQRVASLVLGRSVTAVIAEAREQGRTWPQIADQIRMQTGGEVGVTGEAIRLWHLAAQTSAQAGAA